MQVNARTLRRRPDYYLLFLALFLTAAGLVSVFSASAAEAIKYGNQFYYLIRQLIFTALGLGALTAGALLDHNLYKKWSGFILAAGILSLLLLFVPFLGKSVGGAVRWIDLGFVQFQPSEFVKFAFVVYLASALSNKGERIKDLISGFLPLLAIVVMICVLIMKQPDLGSVLVIFWSSFLMFFLAGARFLHLGVLAAFSVGAVLVLSIIEPYRLARLLAFRDPWSDPKGIGYHIIQSLIAVGSGGLFGLGIGLGRQKFFYIPQPHTDFIFAVICEEAGMIGAIVLIAAFLALIFRCFQVASNCKDKYSFLLACGFASSVFLQVVINMGVVIGLVPTTGIPLPLISYGGTSLFLTLFSIGVIMNISSSESGRGEIK